MELQKNFTIQGKVVHHVGRVGKSVDVYTPEDDDLDITFFFVQDGKVTHTLDVEAEMGQGTGFISGYEIKEV